MLKDNKMLANIDNLLNSFPLLLKCLNFACKERRNIRMIDNVIEEWMMDFKVNGLRLDDHHFRHD